MTRYTAITALAGLMAISACQQRGPATTPVPVSSNPPSSVSIPSTRSTSWTINPSNKRAEYQLTRTASLEHSGVDHQAADSFTTVLNFSTATGTSARGVSFSAEVQAVHNQNSQVMPITPFSFSGYLRDNNLKIETINRTAPSSVLDCTSGQLAFAAEISQTIIVVPAQLQTGTSWTDSIATEACAGPVPATLSITRTYRVIRGVQLDGAEAILLQHTDKTALAGEGSQEQHRVTVRGTGSGNGESQIDAVSGALISMKNDRVMALTITASGKDQHFQQRVRELIERVR